MAIVDNIQIKIAVDPREALREINKLNRRIKELERDRPRISANVLSDPRSTPRLARVAAPSLDRQTLRSLPKEIGKEVAKALRQVVGTGGGTTRQQPSPNFAGLGVPVAAGIGTALLAKQLLDLTTQAIQAGGEIERLDGIIFNFSGTTARGAENLENINETITNIGLSAVDAKRQLAGFLAATEGTALEPVGGELFTGFLEAAKVRGSTREEIQNASRALQQIASKGVVQQEELKGQLAEALPGATQVAAGAFGFTSIRQLNQEVKEGVESTEFLTKFLAALNVDAQANSVKTFASENDRLVASVENLRAAYGQLFTESLTPVVGFLADTINGFSGVVSGAEQLSQGLILTTAIVALANIVTLLNALKGPLTFALDKLSGISGVNFDLTARGLGKLAATAGLAATAVLAVQAGFDAFATTQNPFEEDIEALKRLRAELNSVQNAQEELINAGTGRRGDFLGGAIDRLIQGLITVEQQINKVTSVFGGLGKSVDSVINKIPGLGGLNQATAGRAEIILETIGVEDTGRTLVTGGERAQFEAIVGANELIGQFAQTVFEAQQGLQDLVTKQAGIESELEAARTARRKAATQEARGVLDETVKQLEAQQTKVASQIARQTATLGAIPDKAESAIEQFTKDFQKAGGDIESVKAAETLEKLKDSAFNSQQAVAKSTSVVNEFRDRVNESGKAIRRFQANLEATLTARGQAATAARAANLRAAPLGGQEVALVGQQIDQQRLEADLRDVKAARDAVLEELNLDFAQNILEGLQLDLQSGLEAVKQAQQREGLRKRQKEVLNTLEVFFNLQQRSVDLDLQAAQTRADAAKQSLDFQRNIQRTADQLNQTLRQAQGELISARGEAEKSIMDLTTSIQDVFSTIQGIDIDIQATQSQRGLFGTSVSATQSTAALESLFAAQKSDIEEQKELDRVANDLRQQQIDLENVRFTIENQLITAQTEAKEATMGLVDQFGTLDGNLRVLDQSVIDTGLEFRSSTDEIVAAMQSLPDAMKDAIESADIQVSSTTPGAGNVSGVIGTTGATGIGTGAHLDIRAFNDSSRKNRVGAERLMEIAKMFQAGTKNLTDFQITSGFGPRQAPVPGASTFHPALDFGTPADLPLRFLGQATDIRQRPNLGKAGNVLEITLPTGEIVQLLHLNQFGDAMVQATDMVQQASQKLDVPAKPPTATGTVPPAPGVVGTVSGAVREEAQALIDQTQAVRERAAEVQKEAAARREQLVLEKAEADRIRVAKQEELRIERQITELTRINNALSLEQTNLEKITNDAKLRTLETISKFDKGPEAQRSLKILKDELNAQNELLTAQLELTKAEQDLDTLLSNRVTIKEQLAQADASVQPVLMENLQLLDMAVLKTQEEVAARQELLGTLEATLDLRKQEVAVQADIEAAQQRIREQKLFDTGKSDVLKGRADDIRDVNPFAADNIDRIVQLNDALVQFEERKQQLRLDFLAAGLSEDTEQFKAALANLELAHEESMARIKDNTNTLKNMFEEVMTAPMNDFFMSIFTGTKSAGEAFGDMARSMLTNILQISTKALTANIFGNLFGGIGGGTGGIVGSLFGALNQGVDSVEPMPAFAMGTEKVPNFAMGEDKVSKVMTGLGKAISRERKAGGKPVIGVLSAGEAVLSTQNRDAQTFRRLKKQGIWDRLKRSDKVSNNFRGVDNVGSTSPTVAMMEDLGRSRLSSNPTMVTQTFNSKVVVNARDVESFNKSKDSIEADRLQRERRNSRLLSSVSQ